QNMFQVTDPLYLTYWNSYELIENYWSKVYGRLVTEIPANKNDSLIVRYEDLITNPVETTGIIFRFIGSQQEEGVEYYRKPADFEWEWGTDDGGEKIRTLKVDRNALSDKKPDQDLEKIIQSSQKAVFLRKIFDYPVKL